MLNKASKFAPAEGDPVLDLLVGPLPPHQTAGSTSQFVLVLHYEPLRVPTEQIQLLRPALIQVDVFREVGLKPEVSGRVVYIPQDGVDSYKRKKEVDNN